MTNNNITKAIKEGLMDGIPNLKEEQILIDSHLKNDLGLDSLSSMFFLTYLEDHIDGFEVNADTIEARHFNTFQTIYDYILSEIKTSVSA